METIPENKKYLVAYFDCYRFSPLANELNLTNLMTLLDDLQSLLDSVVKQKEMELQLFSDFGFLIYDISIYLKPKGKYNVREAINNFIDVLIRFCDIYLERDILLRGGVSFGSVMSANNRVVGEPVIQAVRIEQKCIAPIILIPAKVLFNIADPPWFNVFQIPMKDNFVFDAMPIFPTDIRNYLIILKEMQRQACFEMTEYSGTLTRAVDIVNS